MTATVNLTKRASCGHRRRYAIYAVVCQGYAWRCVSCGHVQPPGPIWAV